jgi:hypothetical protein
MKKMKVWRVLLVFSGESDGKRVHPEGVEPPTLRSEV